MIKINGKILLVLILMTFFLFPGTFGQVSLKLSKKDFVDKVEYKKIKKNLHEGNKSFIEKNYQSAVNSYLKIYEHFSIDAGLNFHIGICFLFAYPKTNALQYLKKAVELDKSMDTSILFYKGLAYQYAYMFDSAIACFREFEKSASSLNFPTLKMNTQKKIRECKNGLEFCVIDSNTVNLVNIGNIINSPYPEYRSIIGSDNKLYFSSVSWRSQEEGVDPVAIENSYFTMYNNGQWSKPEKLFFDNRGEFNNVIVGIAPNGNTLIFYDGELNDGDLYLRLW
ncbi:MAG: hypothetical protein ACOCWG_02450, partial [bacterium]